MIEPVWKRALNNNAPEGGGESWPCAHCWRTAETHRWDRRGRLRCADGRVYEPAEDDDDGGASERLHRLGL